LVSDRLDIHKNKGEEGELEKKTLGAPKSATSSFHHIYKLFARILDI